MYNTAQCMSLVSYLDVMNEINNLCCGVQVTQDKRGTQLSNYLGFLLKW
jgi:hypothetical protein